MVLLILVVDRNVVLSFITALCWQPFVENTLEQCNRLKPLHQCVRLKPVWKKMLLFFSFFYRDLQFIVLRKKKAINIVQSAFIPKSD